MPTKLILGLKEFNKDNKQLWTVPRKGTAPHSNLLKMMGREDLAKRQDEYRYNQIVKRQEELSRLEHNLGMVVKANKIRKFLGTVKEKVAEKKKAKGKKTEISKMSFGEEEKEKEVPSLAEQVLFNPDLLRKIGGYKKNMELSDELKKIVRVLRAVIDTLSITVTNNRYTEDYVYKVNKRIQYYTNTFNSKSDEKKYLEYNSYNIREKKLNPLIEDDRNMYKSIMNKIGFSIFYKDDEWKDWETAEIETEEKFDRYDDTKCETYSKVFTKMIKIIECWLANKKCFNVIYEERVVPPYSADFHLEEDLGFIVKYFPKGSISIYGDIEMEEDSDEEDEEDEEDNNYDDDDRPYEYTIMFEVDK